MLIPSIDIIEANAVQLIGGEKMALNAGCPRTIAEKFSRVGPMAVIDLDAALGKGSNAHVIEDLCQIYRCRVGGGIRDIETARRWLDAGAEHIIIGTRARPEFLAQLPKERLIAALDARDGEVVVEGWQTKTGAKIIDRMVELREFVSGFLVTFVECEGQMQGTRLDLVAGLVEAAGDAKVTIAGGITTAEDIAALDRMGGDAQVGMALYTGTLGLAEAFSSPMKTDRSDGLWTTVVVDEYDRALGLCYSNLESVRTALESGTGVYWSRKRGLWKKGEQSGHRQRLIAIDMDCDRDTLRFKVRQTGPGFCHLDSTSCWGQLKGLPALFQTIQKRARHAPEGSYTQRLFEDHELLKAKLIEEAQELGNASSVDNLNQETADVLYFSLVALCQGGGSLDEVIGILDKRHQKISRRAGDAKVKIR